MAAGDDAGTAEFEHAFGFTCEQALREVLGATGFASTVYYLSKDGVSLVDGARRPDEFDDSLSVLFNPTGAILLEGRILGRFYHSLGIKFDWNDDGMVFKEEVREAAKRFDWVGKHAPTPPSQNGG
jgi:hypothetical protein